MHDEPDPLAERIVAMICAMEPHTRLDTSPTGFRLQKTVSAYSHRDSAERALKPYTRAIVRGRVRVVAVRFTDPEVKITIQQLRETAW